MGIRIVTKSKKFTVQDFSEFLEHLNILYQDLVFLYNGRDYNIPDFDKAIRRHSEPLYVAEITKKSPLNIVVVPSISYGDAIQSALSILAILISLRSKHNKKTQRDSEGEEHLKREIKKALETDNKIYNDALVREMMELYYNRIEMDKVNIENITYNDLNDDDDSAG